MPSMVNVLKEYGVPYMVDPRYHLAANPTWDGKVLRVPNEPDKIVAWVMHEVSHHLVATPEGRKDPNYGLGSDPGGGATVSATGNCRGAYPEEDEQAVCLLDLWLLKKHGFEGEIEHHARDYGISGYTPKDLAVCLEILNEAGLPGHEIVKHYKDVENPS